MAKSLKFPVAILCEHVVNGERGKKTLVNVYGGDVIVSDFPAHLMFGLYLELIPDSADISELELEIRIGKKALFKILISLRDAKPNRPASIAIPLFNVELDKEQLLSVYANSEGYRKTKVLRKRIFKGELPAI